MTNLYTIQTFGYIEDEGQYLGVMPGDTLAIDASGDLYASVGSYTIYQSTAQSSSIEEYKPASNGYGIADADNSLLLVDSATLDGVAVPESSLVLSNNGPESFTFPNPIAPPVITLGTGPDTLALFVAERAEPMGAQFTIDVNGVQVGGVQTTSADVLAGQAQEFNVQGTFAAGTNTVTINYLNASNSLLFVDSASLDGTTIAGSTLVLSNTGPDSFSFTGPTTVQSTTSIGSGPDTLALDLSQRAEPAGAQFTVSVDGTQIGGEQTVMADVLAGQSQELDVQGDFVPDQAHTVSVTYQNASNSLLFVDSATINGTTIADGGEVLSNNGSLGFGFATPDAPAATVLGSGPDMLALTVSEAYAQGNAAFTISVDGTQVGGVQTAAAIQGNGQSQVFDIQGAFAGAHSVAIELQNPATSAAGTARTLFVGGATIDGSAIANSAFALTSTMPQGFSFTNPASG